MPTLAMDYFPCLFTNRSQRPLQSGRHDISSSSLCTTSFILCQRHAHTHSNNRCSQPYYQVWKAQILNLPSLMLPCIWLMIYDVYWEEHTHKLCSLEVPSHRIVEKETLLSESTAREQNRWFNLIPDNQQWVVGGDMSFNLKRGPHVTHRGIVWWSNLGTGWDDCRIILCQVFNNWRSNAHRNTFIRR